MSIVKVIKRDTPYVQIDKTPVNDGRLSWKAKGLLLYLISKPDEWKVQVTDLVKHASDGRDAVYSILNELIAAGYVERRQEPDKERGGLFGEIEYEVRELPSHRNKIKKEDKRKPPRRSESVDNSDDFTAYGNSGNGQIPLTEIQETEPLTETPYTVPPFTDEPDVINKDFNNNDFKDKEEDYKKADYKTYVLQDISQDIKTAKQAFESYEKIIDRIEADATENLRPVYPEEIEFLEQLDKIPVHSDTAYDLFLKIQNDLSRQRKMEKGDIIALLHRAFIKFRLKLETGRNFGKIDEWFSTTWNSERITIEQEHLIREATRKPSS